jgi:hypothetical protein
MKNLSQSLFTDDMVKQVEIDGRTYGLSKDGEVYYRLNTGYWEHVGVFLSLNFNQMCRLVREFEHLLPYL